MKVSSKCLVSLPQEEDQSSSFFVASTRSLRSLNEVRILRSTACFGILLRDSLFTNIALSSRILSSL